MCYTMGGEITKPQTEETSVISSFYFILALNAIAGFRMVIANSKVEINCLV